MGWALVCAGILGIILPVIPGVPLLIGGLVVLSARYRWAAVGVRWLKRKVRQASRRKEQKETIGA
ncbi:MAG TPA: PGPGW domain-containing protein [Acidobacteriaceae bacterium]